MLNKDFWQGKKVFLTGHTGFKGAWLSLCLKKLGANVTGYSLESPTDPSLFKIAKLGNLMESKLGDICDFQDLCKKMKYANPDIVIHMAAQALVRDSYIDPLQTYQTNVVGTANVLESVRQCKNIKAVLIVTTDKCYENKEWYWGYREDEALGGYDPYSSSKACAEIVTAAYRQSFLRETGIAVATVRAGNVIGGGDWAKDRLIPDCLRAIEKKEKIIIRNPQAIRPWQHVLDPLRGYMMLTEKLYEEGNDWAESWNFGPYAHSVLCVGDVVEKICTKLNATYAVQKLDNLHEANYLKLDCSKANMKLKWQPTLSMDDSLEYIIDWFNAYRNGEDMQKFSVMQIEKYCMQQSSTNIVEI
ncbi:CDP-glucose 4,6-dehydratase [Anaerosinus massiliensis]|uniref:CDP-glucose 4,6-dehydratase n=1 Tax=Massilibacillus massiliensis TaxID=1806837 RepID=UPI000AB0A88B|nr:CDP-glucose 4,6-dehydratase [Massilibacillus massiliensis]